MHDHFLLAASNLNCKISLQINTIRFPGEILRGDWLGNEHQYNILRLRILDRDIHDVLADGFNPNAFADLTTLELNGLRINFLREGVFKYLTKLKSLIIQKSPLKYIDLNAFAMNKNLFEISILYCMTMQMRLIGADEAAPLRTLRLLQLLRNDFADTLTRNSFSGMPHLVTLDLSSDKITFLPNDVFFLLPKTLQKVRLTNNLLKILSPIIFEKHLPYATFQISSNRFHCDQEITGLKNLLIRYKENFDEPLCSSPTTHECDKISETLVFETTSSTRTTIITTIESTSTMQTDLNYRKLCIKHSSTSSNDGNSWINIAKRQIQLKIRLTYDEAKMILNNFPANISWFWMESEIRDSDGSFPSNFGCFVNKIRDERSIEIDKIIKYGKLYSICAMARSEVRSEPLNCLSFTIGRSFNVENLWIATQYRYLFIVLMITVGTMCAIAGIGLIVLMSLRYPNSIETFLEKIHFIRNER